jgi:hypothetical protein
MPTKAQLSRMTLSELAKEYHEAMRRTQPDGAAADVEWVETAESVLTELRRREATLRIIASGTGAR